MRHRLSEAFKNPGSEFRGAPFWAWNGKLSPPELQRQIRLMHRMGLGGFFMHSRVGLDTPYLSDDWFACVRACIEQAAELGMKAWLYDEDRWPSGAAGGLVTKDPRYRARELVLDILAPRDFRWEEGTLAAFLARVKGANLSEVKRLARDEKPGRGDNGRRVLAFRVKTQECRSWYNGYTYLDTMNHEAVRRFIDVTHEAYRKRCGDAFGGIVPGIFTDEPHHTVKLGRQGTVMPWTERLPAVFRQRYGYDLLEHLPELFFDVEGRTMLPARYHYHDCVTHLFVDAFARQIGEWCEKHGLLHTGHALYEGSLDGQTGCVGSCMRFYEHMQAPGMDILTEVNREYDTAKQVSSAARQFGRHWRLTETYGCTGWDFPLAGHKAIGDWQVALGINLRCQHLAWYTMIGQAKRDYPASIFVQSPWWNLYAKVEDYFARIHAVMTRGHEVRDLLVIHPVESAWMLCRRTEGKDTERSDFSSRLVKLRDALLGANLDFDYGDEDILARHGRMSRKGGDVSLFVGKARYRAVIVPRMLTMRQSTVALLKRFQRAGGRVVFVGEPARYVDAVASQAVAELADNCTKVTSEQEAVSGVDAVCRRVSICDEQGRQIPDTLYLLREDAENLYLFICNTGHDFRSLKVSPGRRPATDLPVRERRSAFPVVHITGFESCAGTPLEADPETGQMYRADARRAAKRWKLQTSLPALGSRLFVVPKRGQDSKLPKRPVLRDVRRSTLSAPAWPIALTEENCLVLDRPAYRIGKRAWQAGDDVLRVDAQVRAALGVDPRGGQMCQPWTVKREQRPASVPLRLVYSFEVKSKPSGPLYLGLERPDLFRVALNGVDVSTDMDRGWWTDPCLRKVPLESARLRQGTNRIELRCDYTKYHPGLETVYLLGMFGAFATGTDVCMGELPGRLSLGDWTGQGLSFYSGSVVYRRTLRRRSLRPSERLFVEVPDYRGVAVRVLIDGQAAGTIAWEPNEVDITPWLGRGSVELGIEVMGHRRNSLGPLHHAETWPRWTGPQEFITRGDLWVDRYQLVPCGLMASPRLAVKTLA